MPNYRIIGRDEGLNVVEIDAVRLRITDASLADLESGKEIPLIDVIPSVVSGQAEHPFAQAQDVEPVQTDPGDEQVVEAESETEDADADDSVAQAQDVEPVQTDPGDEQVVEAESETEEADADASVAQAQDVEPAKRAKSKKTA